jgi:hypothetical protein
VLAKKNSLLKQSLHQNVEAKSVFVSPQIRSVDRQGSRDRYHICGCGLILVWYTAMDGWSGSNNIMDISAEPPPPMALPPPALPTSPHQRGRLQTMVLPMPTLRLRRKQAVSSEINEHRIHISYYTCAAVLLCDENGSKSRLIRQDNYHPSWP